MSQTPAGGARSVRGDGVKATKGAGVLGIELVGGSGIFLAFVIGYALAVTYALYGRRTGISSRPYARRYSGAPGADGAPL
jgi:hypothetical protein